MYVQFRDFFCTFYGVMISRFFNFHACVCTLQAYNCSVELSWAPFLVRQNKNPAPVNAIGNAKESETLQIDTIDEQAEDWKRAHILGTGGLIQSLGKGTLLFFSFPA